MRELNFFYAATADAGGDGALNLRPLAGGLEQMVLENLPFTFSMPSGGGLAQDDGLAGTYDHTVRRSVVSGTPDTPVGGALYETRTEELRTYYAFGGMRSAGGTITAYNALYVDRHYTEFVLRDGVVVHSRSTPFGTPRLIEKYTPGPIDAPFTGGPLLSGLAFLGAPHGAGERSIGLYGVLDHGPGNPGTVVDVQTDFRLATPDVLAPVMDFAAPLHGGLAASRERGTLFAVADIQTVDGPAVDRAVMEFDPRTAYLRDAWSSLGGDLVGAGLDDPAARVKGAAFVAGRLVLSLDRDPAAQSDFSPRYVTIDPDAGGSVVAAVQGAPASVTGLTELANLDAALAPSVPLNEGRSIIDTAGINELFARISYSQQALDSGVVQRLFEKHFRETAADPERCTRGNPVFDQIPSKLARHIDTRGAFGAVAHDLRNPGGVPLPAGEACAVPMPAP